MNVREAIRNSLRLLSARDRRRLLLVTFLQTITGFLDLIGVFLLGAVGALSVTVLTKSPIPSSIQSVVDRFGLGGIDATSLAGLLALAAGVCLITKSILTIWLSRRTLRFLANRQAQLSANLTASLLSRPLLEVQAVSSQNTAYVLIMGTQAAMVGVLGSASSAISDVALLLVLGIGLTAVDPIVTLFTVGFFAVFAFGLHRLMAGWASRLGEQQATVDVESGTTVQEAVASYREVTVAGRRSFYIDRIQKLRWTSAVVSSDIQFLTLIPKYAFEIALVLGGIMLAGIQFATKDAAAAVAVVTLFLVAGSRVMPAVMRLQVGSLTIRRSAALAAPTYRLADQLSQHSPPLDTESREAVSAWLRNETNDFIPTLRVTNAQMIYPGSSTPELEDASFEVPAGASVAFVGATGAGKSTLADIVLGVVHPTSGSVEIGGVAPAAAIARWPGGLGYVPQEVALVNGTVRDNVALGLPADLTDDHQVWASLSRAHLSDFLKSGRDGLETRIGERGMRLSGGQRQRLGVARALYSRPRFLVLDEATSALDAETEQAIAATLRGLEGDVTTVTVAHRLATIRHVDLVLYLEHGRIVARGTFAEVREQSKAFDRQARLLGL